MSTTNFSTTAQATPGPLAAARPISLWRHVGGHEWRLLRREPAWWLAVALLLACLAYALAGGRQWVAQRAEQLRTAQADEARRLAVWQQALGRIERGEAKPPAAAYRDPRNAWTVGRNTAATVVGLAPAPLAPLAVGVSDLWPTHFVVGAGSRDSFLFVEDIANPSLLLAGRFDLAFVLVYLLPLLLMAGSASLYAGELEQGTLALTAAAPVPLARVLRVKLLVRGGSLLLVAVLGAAGGLALLAPPGALPLADLGWLALGIAAYGSFWLALAWAVNALRRGTAFNTLVLACAWLLLVVLAPALISAWSALAHPAPARADVVLAVREAAVDAERDREASQARYQQDHAGTPEGGAPRDEADARTRRAVAVSLAAEARAEQLLARHELQIEAQQQAVGRAAWGAPPVLMAHWLADLAGNGPVRWRAHLQAVAQFHGQWRSYFVARASRGQHLASADAARLPRWQAAAAPATPPAERAAPPLLWLALSAGLLLWGQRRLQTTA